MTDLNLRGNDIIKLLKENDKAGGRALRFLMLEQTADEQAVKRSRHENKRGFNKGDAKRGTEDGKYFEANGTLTPAQLLYWREPIHRTNGKPTFRIAVYWHQLLIQSYRNHHARMKMAA